MTPNLPFEFRSSSYSGGNGGNCIQPAINLVQSHGVVGVRDSKDPDGPVLVFTTSAWTAFATATADGYFDNA
jgi:hypothetical protein